MNQYKLVLVQKSEEPEGDFSAKGGLDVVGKDIGVLNAGHLGEFLALATNLNGVMVVNLEVAMFFAVFYLVLESQLVDNKGFAGCANLHIAGGDGI